MGSARRRRVGRVLSSVVAGVMLCACSSGDGVTTVEPSSAQLSAMSGYFLEHFAGDRLGISSTAGVGCATESLGTRPHTGNQTIVYSLVFCGQCPIPGGPGGWTPVAFFLQGRTVTTARAAEAQVDPGFTEDVQDIFPRQLWRAAEEQQVPDGSAFSSQAAKRAGCR